MNRGILKPVIIAIIIGVFCFEFLIQEILSSDNAGLIWKSRPEIIHVEDTESSRFSFIFHRDTSSAITITRFFIKGGKRAEPENLKGLAFITTRLSIELQAQSDVRKLQELGSSFAMQVEGDYTVITVRCLSENLDETLKMLTALLKKPLISPLRISYIKKNMEHRQKSEEDNAVELMDREYYNIFCATNGYGGSIYGDKDSVKRIKKKDITNFHEKYFNLSNIVISISSDIPKEKISEILKKHVGSQPMGEQQVDANPEKKRVDVKKKEYTFKKLQTQTLVSLAFRLPKMNAHNFACAYMLETLLGEGMGSRLWPLREEKKLAYHLQARVTYMKEAGILMVHLKTGNANKKTALSSLTQIMIDLYEKGTTDAEFSAVKALTKTCFLRSNETKEMRTFNLGFFETTGLGYEFLEVFFPGIESMTIVEFNAYIKDVLNPGNMVRLLIGPGDEE